MATIKVWVNYSEEKVLSEKQYKETLEENNKDWYNDRSVFDEWLSNNYTRYEIFYLTDEEKEELLEEFHDYCDSRSQSELEEDWVLEEIDV